MILYAPLPLADWLALFGHFLLLSLLAVGGAITVAPDMHRLLVGKMQLLDDAQFGASIAIAQAAPGPNVLFVAVLGYQAAGVAGALTTMIAMLLPSTTLALAAGRWGQSRAELIGVRAFKSGMAPVVIGLLLATSWVLARAHGVPALDWPLWLLTAATMLLVWRTKLHLLWMLGAGALLGALGLV